MTDFTKVGLETVIPAIDRKRIELDMSYQALADACDISKSTAIRYLRLEIEPPYTFVQKAAAAVRLEPKERFVFPEDHTIEGHNEYLKHVINKKDDDIERLKNQHHAEINRLRAHYLRMIAIISVALGGALVLFFIAFIAFRAIDMRITNNAVKEAVDLCEACYSEIAEHSQFCAWCGHEQVSRFGNM